MFSYNGKLKKSIYIYFFFETETVLFQFSGVQPSILQNVR